MVVKAAMDYYYNLERSEIWNYNLIFTICNLTTCIHFKQITE